MLNRPLNDWHGELHDEASWTPDAAPRGRLLAMAICCCLPLVLIGVRLAQLQLTLQTDFTAPFSETTSSEEVIPSRNGRILSSDGIVLAEDLERFDLLVHYRWLQSPPDAGWLRQQALRRLPRAARRTRELVDAEIAQVEQEQAAAWDRLAVLLGIAPQDLEAARQSIQQRVEGIAERVRQRRDERALASPSTVAPTSWWQWFLKELTTPPTRHNAEPLVIAEELDYHVLWPAIPAPAAAELQANPQRYGLVRVSTDTRRHYPQRGLAAHCLGHRTPARPEDRVEPGVSTVGRSGLEQTYDEVLRGRAGRRRLTRTRQGQVIADEVILEPRHGQDLVLHLDAGLQRFAERLLDGALNSEDKAAVATKAPDADEDESAQSLALEAPPRGGAIVAMDLVDGAILAAASGPRFDANVLVRGGRSEYDALAADERQPFFSRATQMALPPGSVFKVLTSLALTEAGAIDPHALFHCQGYLDHPHQHRCLTYRHYGVGHGDLGLPGALCRSCNVFFFDAARRAGPGPLVSYARQCGFGMPTGIDVPGEAAGTLPSPGGANAKQPWYPGTTLGLAIGQASLRVTPLQMARMIAAVANDGTLLCPRLAQRVGSVGEASAATTDLRWLPEAPRTHLKLRHPEALPVIRQGLDEVVNDPHGTAYKTVRLEEVRIAGKTGTAEVGAGRRDHAWFVGYVPAERPRIAFVVVLEHGGSGGKQAGPIARKFVQGLLERQLISRDRVLAEKTPR